MNRAILLIGGLVMATSTTVAAQSNPVVAAFEGVASHLIAAAEMVSANHYAFRPTEGVRTYLQLIAHVADGNDYYCRHAAGDAIEWDTPAERDAATREAALAALRASVERCREAFARADADLASIADGLAHASLHYGNVIVYLRLMGYVPPSS